MTSAAGRLAAASGISELAAEAELARTSYGEGALVVCDRLVRIYALEGIEVQALQGLDLLIGKGELTAVVGASGSGKSTLMNILAGLDTPTAGSVRVAGHDLSGMTARERLSYRRQVVGFVWQQTSRNLLPYLTAWQNVVLPMRLRGAGRRERSARTAELLAVLGVTHCADRRPDQMSGGEQQRAAIATALANRPDLLLADEPTGELDAATAEQVYGMLAELVREQGCTTVIVSHDPSSTRIADRIVRIRDGRVSEEWGRGDEGGDTIVVGRGGWLRLPEELLLRAGIGAKATARFEDGGVVVTPAAGTSVEPARRSDPGVLAPAAEGVVVAELHGVERRYGETVALRPTDAAFRAGCLHAVTGPSGSGKTTLLHLLAGLELPDAGSVSVGGVDLTALDRTGRARLRREQIAYVGQQAGLVPHLSALENVELALALRGSIDGHAAALAALDAVGLSERATQRVARLSQGERARVAIARAAAARPALLLADEPTSRLDAANAIAVAILLARIARETGTAIVCATHDPLVIEQAESQLLLN